MTILAIDPGCDQSAFVIWDGSNILRHGKLDNKTILDEIVTLQLNADKMIVEQIASFGMPVGKEVFETVFWSGRFCEAFNTLGKPFDRIPRMDVKMHLCHSSRATDANIRQALIDRWGGSAAIKAYRKANPKKGEIERPQGSLYGITDDQWAALGVAVTFTDTRERQ